MTRTPSRAIALAVLVVLSVLSAPLGGATAQTSVLEIDATPSDPNEAESTHAVVVPVAADAGIANRTFNDVVVDYTVGTHVSDVSNVGANTLGTVGIDRGGDSPGTRVDVTATVTTVSGKKDGGAVRIATAGNHTLRTGDEVVVVLTPVQNPQNPGESTVEVTVNSQGAADSVTGPITYEYNDASVRFANQSADDGTVTVRSVNLSEGGFVAVANRSGENPGAVRGTSAYLPAGTHENVTVALDVPVDENTTLYAQVHMDTNADRRFRFGESGGEVDGPYLTRDGNVMASDPAQVRPGGGSDGTDPTPTATPDDSDSPTPTESSDGTVTPTATATPTPTSTMHGDPGTGTPTPTDSPTPTPVPPTGTSPTPSATSTDASGPGFGSVAALAGLFAAALLATRR